MALPKVSPGLLPAENYNRFNAAFSFIDDVYQALNDAVRNLQNADATEITARQQAIAAAVQTLRQAVADEASARQGLQTSLEQAVGNLTAGINGVAQARTDGDNALSRSITESDAQHDAFEAGATVKLTALADALDAVEGRLFDFVRSLTRPGDGLPAFCRPGSLSGLGGDGGALPTLPASAIALGDSGAVVRVIGSSIVAARQAVAIEPARLYRARFVVQRRANPTDPSNDAVQLVLVWLDQGMNVLPPTDNLTVVTEIDDLVVNDVRQERVVTFARAPGTDVQLRTPTRARYARAAVVTYGIDGVTDIEVLGIEDITSAVVLAPETADTVQRVQSLESINAGQRLTALESQVSAPNSVTYATKSDASAATIPETVTTVELRGAVQATDGAGGLYARIQGSLPAGADGFTSGGVAWQRVTMAQATFNAFLSAGFSGWFASLPTSLPAQAGVPWNNSGLLAIS